MSNIFVLGLQPQSYITKSGDLVNRLVCHYFDISDLQNSRLERGYFPLNQDVIKSYTVKDFPEIPAFYDVIIRPDPVGGKTRSRFAALKFLSALELPSSESYLVLGAKVVKDYEVDGKKINGIKLFYLDTTAHSAGDYTGFMPVSSFISGFTIKLPSQLPAFCNFEFSESRGNNGQALLKIVSSSFQVTSPFEFKQPVSA